MKRQEFKNWRFFELTVLAGKKARFPVCCIIQFALEIAYDQNPAQERINEFGEKLEKVLHSKNNGYIPCSRCANKYIRKYYKRLK